MFDLSSVTKALLLGDSHGDPYFMRRAVSAAKDHDCDCIFQVGDFGYWPRDTRTSTMFLKDYGLPVVFLDGNHEDHDELEKFTEDINEVAPNIFYIPRGSVHEISGKRILFIGGAYSIDWKSRVKGIDWFPQEQITQEQLEKCLEHKNIDMVLTHDCPMSCNIVGALNYPSSIHNREKLQKVQDALSPDFWFFGHYHKPFKKYDYHTDTFFHCLVANVNQDRIAVSFNFVSGKMQEIDLDAAIPEPKQSD